MPPMQAPLKPKTITNNTMMQTVSDHLGLIKHHNVGMKSSLTQPKLEDKSAVMIILY